MRLPRLRFRISTFLLAVALVPLVLVVYTLNRDGPEARWLLLKLRYGNVATRRSAAIEALQSEGQAKSRDMFDFIFPNPTNPRTLEAEQRGRRRRAELLLPALARAANDPDAACRAHSLHALGFLAALHASDFEKLLTLHQVLAATRDPDDSVRTAAVGALGGLAGPDTETVINALRSALADSSLEVRQKAVWELGFVGVSVPATQADVAAILIPLLASREESRVRVQAAWSMSFFGVDSFRHPPTTGPDVVPALVAALKDPDVEVCRATAVILGLTTSDAQGRKISKWEQRKAAISPPSTRRSPTTTRPCDRSPPWLCSPWAGATPSSSN
ncbi:MAG: HEAT repeat domain-containing protein [Paludisphaera borealis]|uniref:HEAT repeat domain-containing protein n=1 Tax=Paludisphaera borealis TaxID=1387353 RepID=UPI002848BEFB|nr:HEAT repeat domain-containing protein [Paludisphaera borealis]MDR3617813.1 HEAT repeat domain-containing protein [Paludisphaera borealis]